jgi:hypothetical protein
VDPAALFSTLANNSSIDTPMVRYVSNVPIQLPWNVSSLWTALPATSVNSDGAWVLAVGQLFSNVQPNVLLGDLEISVQNVNGHQLLAQIESTLNDVGGFLRNFLVSSISGIDLRTTLIQANITDAGLLTAALQQHFNPISLIQLESKSSLQPTVQSLFQANVMQDVAQAIGFSQDSTGLLSCTLVV